MGAKNNRQRKGSFSLISMFKRGIKQAMNTSNHGDQWEEVPRVRKVYHSDEDGLNWPVAEPGIDWRASVFIARFHEARLSEAQTMAIQQN